MPLIKWKQIDATSVIWATGLRANKSMVASVTVADGDLACATAVATTPAPSTALGGYIMVCVNTAGPQLVGDGTKVAVDCYFSADGGVTARLLRNVVAGDLLYWNGSVAGFQLAATDRVSLFFPVAA